MWDINSKEFNEWLHGDEIVRQKRKEQEEKAKEEDQKNFHELPNPDKQSSEFIEQVEQLQDDLNECLDDAINKIINKREKDDVFECYEIAEEDAESYYSESYDYEIKSQAKVACKSAVEAAVNSVREKYRDEKNDIVYGCNKFITKIEGDVMDLIEEFQTSIYDYISLDFEEELQLYAKKMVKELISRRMMLDEYTNLNLMERSNKLANDLIDSAIVKLPSIQSYLKLCTYDQDEYDDYCFIMDSAIEKLNEDISEIYDEMCDTLEVEIRKLYQAVLADFVEIIKNHVSMMGQNA